MKFLDFMCWDGSVKLVHIKIPEECCGYKISLFGTFNKSNGSSLAGSCINHMRLFSDMLSNYNTTWKAQYETSCVTVYVNHPPTSSNGRICKSCSILNEYALSNQDDGSYICFNCR
jgi:hypothetical protein